MVSLATAVVRALLPALVLVLCGCAGVEDEPPQVRVTHQPLISLLDGGPQVTGTMLLGHLGAVITSCPLRGYAAGAPGDDTVWFSPTRSWLDPARTPVSSGDVNPFPVVCLGSPGAQRVIVGGPANAYLLRTDAGPSSQLVNVRVDALDADPGAWLAVGSAQPGQVQLFPSSATSLSSSTFTTSPTVPGFGTSLAWNRVGALLVANAITRTVVLIPPDTSVDGGRLLINRVSLVNPDPSGTNNDYGAVVVTGNVLPDTGEETIVSAPQVGRVYVFSGTAAVMTLQGGTSFGAALAVDSRDLGGGLHGLWIGEPDQDQVHFYFGDAGTVLGAPQNAMNTRFGAAIAVDTQGLIAIGAPNFTEILFEVGAVFEASMDAGVRIGAPRYCDAGVSCKLSGCTPGICVGGVFCEAAGPAGSECTLNQRCDSSSNVCLDGGVDAGPRDAGLTDSGISDAGLFDGGSPTDAGSVLDGGVDAGASNDAGPSTDAGSFTDAGSSTDGGELADGGLEQPEVFQTQTCGCTSGGLPLLALLGLVLARRRRFA